MKRQTKQRGVTLITALVMLVVLTLLVISAIRSSNVNLRIAGNMQIQEEAIAAAQQATEQVLSTNFTANPASAAVAASSVTIGPATYTTTVATPVCTGSKPLDNTTANLPRECISSSTAQNTGIFFASGTSVSGTSWCLAQQWDIRASVNDNITGASTTMHQGVNLTVPAGTTCTVTAPTQ